MHPESIETSVQGLPDAELTRRIAAGDDEAFQLLIRRYNPTLNCTARSVLRDDCEAEDAVQEAFLSVYRAIGKFCGDSIRRVPESGNCRHPRDSGLNAGPVAAMRVRLHSVSAGSGKFVWGKRAFGARGNAARPGVI